MRALLLTCLLPTAALAAAQAPVMNELCPANHGALTDSGGATPDWIELHNPSATPIDLQGWRIALEGRLHVIDGPLPIAPKGFALLRCDGRTALGPGHLGFALPRSGGALLLIAPDGATIADLFSYPALPPNHSIGRLPDGARAWSLFPSPTPGRPNNAPAEGPLRGVSQAPALALLPDGRVAIEAEGTARFTTDGSDPRAPHAQRYSGPFAPPPGCVVRAIAHAEGRLPGPEAMRAFPAHGQAGDAFALALEPAHLWGDSSGIYNPGAAHNHTRRGKAWERPALLGIGERAIPVGARIHGSGSRSLHKRSFKLHARPRYGSPDEGFAFADGTRVREGILRADASPHAFLRNAVMEQVVERFGLHLLVQPSEAVPLLLNGAYWGLYRWMPAKDAQWIAQRAGAEAVEVLDGPALAAKNGGGARFLRGLGLLLGGAPLDSIDALIDTRSLIDLACIDLWTGRADHELNVRCYRPKEQGGRWRWVLFDMDLWAPPHENSVQRMALAPAPEAPYAPQLLAHPQLQQRLLARLTALQATAFAQVPAIADSLHRARAAELAADHKRWDLQLGTPTPEASLAEMKGFAAQRPAHLFAHLSRHTGRRLHETLIEAPPAHQGALLLDGLPLAPGRHMVRCFEGVPMDIEFRTAPGHEFAGWRGGDIGTAAGVIGLWKAKGLRPVIRSAVP